MASLARPIASPIQKDALKRLKKSGGRGDGGDGDDGDDGGGKAVVEAGGDNDGHPPANDTPPGAVIDAHALVQVDLPALTECLHELTRQMCVDCRERGDLAQRSWYVEK